MATRQSSRFGELLRRYRLARGLTQEALAERARISPRSVSDIERGVSAMPREDTAQRLAAALDLNEADRADFLRVARDLRLPPSDRIVSLQIVRPLTQLGSLPARGTRLWRLSLIGRCSAVVLLLLVIALTAYTIGIGSSAQSIHSFTRPTVVVDGFDPTIARLRSPSGIAVDLQGNVYTADTGNNRVVKRSPDGLLIAEWGGAGTGPGQFNHPEGIAVDASGHIFVADTRNNRIQELTVDGRPLNQFYGPVGFPGIQFIPHGLALDPRDNLYVVDEGISGVEELSPDGSTLHRWNLSIGQSAAVTVGRSGAVYVADPMSNAIHQLVPSARTISAWSDFSVHPGNLDFPTGVAADRQGNIYVCEPNAGRIEKLSPRGRLLKAWNEAGGNPWTAAVDAQGNAYVLDQQHGHITKFTAAGFPVRGWEQLTLLSASQRIVGVSLDSQGSVYFVDHGTTLDSTVVKTSAQGRPLARFGSGGTGLGALYEPVGLAVDPQGNSYVLNTANDDVEKFSGQGKPLAQWGTYGSGPGQFNGPYGIAADRRGNVYVADSGNHRIEEFSSYGALIGQFGPYRLRNGSFLLPGGLTIDRQGVVYVVDNNNNIVAGLSPTGQLRSVWGYGALGTGGSRAGEFQMPTGVATDSSGDIYVADTGNNRIQEFSPDGKLIAITNEAGTKTKPFNVPDALAVAIDNRVYVVDGGDTRIQAMYPVR